MLLSIPQIIPHPGCLCSHTRRKSGAFYGCKGGQLVLQGTLEGITRLAEATDTPVAMLDYAGHGQHPVPLEESTREQQHREVVAAYDELKAQGYEKIIAIGGSFGSYMAALLAGKRELAGIILRAPAIYDDEHFSTLRKNRDKLGYDELERLVEEQLDLSALEAISKFSKSVYVLEHELDSVIPKNIPRAYFQAAKYGNYLVVPATGHSPKLMPHPQRHFAYIETLLTGLVKTIQLEDTLRES